MRISCKNVTLTDLAIRQVKSVSSTNLLRIVVNKSHYPKFPVNLYFCTIDLLFGIVNLSFRIDSGKFGYTTGILGSTPSSGNMDLTPPVEIW